VVLSDLGAILGTPTSGPIAFASETGSTTAHRLLLTTPCTPGTVHVALVADGAGLSSQATDLTAATRALLDWRITMFP
jgi:hypothetical protein